MYLYTKSSGALSPMIELADILDGKDGKVITVSSGTPLRDAARLLVDRKIGVVIVTTADDGVCGILSERDISTGVANFGADIATMTVGELMTVPVISCSSGDSMVEILVLMEEHHVRHLPVIDDPESGKLLGVAHEHEVVVAYHRALEQLRAEERGEYG